MIKNIMIGLCLFSAASIQAYTYYPENSATAIPWAYLNDASVPDANGLVHDHTIQFVLDPTSNWNAGNTETIVEGFRQFTAAFSSVPMIRGRILFQRSYSSDQPHLLVTRRTGSGANVGCVVENGVNRCTIYLPNATAIRYGIGRALGILNVPAAIGNVLSYSNGIGGIFSDADLNGISSTYPALRLNLTTNPATLPMFVANYSDGNGQEIVFGWSSLRSRLIQTSTRPLSTSGISTLAAVPVSAMDLPAYGFFPLVQYRLAGYWYAWWPQLYPDVSSWDPTRILKGTDGSSPQLGGGTCPVYSGSAVQLTTTPWSAPNPFLFAFSPSNGLFSIDPYFGRLGFSSSNIPSQYFTPLFFYPSGSGYSATSITPPITEPCYRIAGRAFAVM